MSAIIIPDSLNIDEVEEKKEQDKEVFLFNAIEGTFDLALKFNANRILTASRSGNSSIEDPTQDEFAVVTDSKGNVVTV